MKIFRGNDLLGKDDEISFVFKTSFKDKDGRLNKDLYEQQYNMHMAHITVIYFGNFKEVGV